MKSETQQQSQSESQSQKLTEFKPVDATPFIAVKVNDTWMLTLGRYKLYEGLETEEQAKSIANQKDWDLLFKVIQIFMENRIEVNTNLNQNQ